MNLEYFVLKIDKKSTKNYFNFLNTHKYFKDYNISYIKYKRVKSYDNYNKMIIIKNPNELNFNSQDIYKFLVENQFSLKMEDIEIIKLGDISFKIENKDDFNKYNSIWPCYLNYKPVKIFFNNFDLSSSNIDNIKEIFSILESKSVKRKNINYCILIDSLNELDNYNSKENNFIESFDTHIVDNNPINHCFINAINDSSAKKCKEKYLLTDTIVISLYEPCLMCSMALCLSRIKLLIYKSKNEKFESLTSTSLLDKPINYKFQVINNLN